MSRELLLAGPRDLRLAEYDEAPLADDEICAEGIVSGISLGTELATYRGTSPFAQRRFDRDLRLFVESGDASPYPVTLGYEWVGVVREVGGAVREVRAGDVVHLPRPHRDSQTSPVARGRDGLGPLVLPPRLDPERAIFVESASIALNAVHDAGVRPGSRVAVFGLGVFGLLAVQLCRLAGAERIDGLDPVAARRDLALALGADGALDPAALDVALELREIGPAADVAIDFSGRYEALHDAMRCVRLGGTVVAAGFYQGAASALRLGEEFHHNRLTLVSSMGGWGAPHRDHPTWDRLRRRQTALDLLAAGPLAVEGLLTDRVPFERAADAYARIDRDPEAVLRIALTY